MRKGPLSADATSAVLPRPCCQPPCATRCLLCRVWSLQHFQLSTILSGTTCMSAVLGAGGVQHITCQNMPSGLWRSMIAMAQLQGGWRLRLADLQRTDVP